MMEQGMPASQCKPLPTRHVISIYLPSPSLSARGVVYPQVRPGED